MSTNLQQVGTPLLDMDNVATQLHIKGVLMGIDEETGEEQYSPFISLNDLKIAGTDGSLVKYLGVNSDGQPVQINHLAVAYHPDGMPDSEVDRNKVNDSQHLDGHEVDYFYTSEQGSNAEERVNSVIDYYGKEISELRAQNIQLMNFLAKKGVIDNYRPWAGFYDTFRSSYPVHQKGYLATAFVDSPSQNMMRVKDEEIGYFAEGDYVVVVNGDNIYDEMNRKLLRIDKITGTTMVFSGYTGFSIKAEQTHVYRSFATSYKNSFAFGEFEAQHASAKEIYTGVDDDNFRTRRKIKASHTGYATTFRINPNRANGASSYYLSNIEIAAKKIGSPGDLKCYIINAANIDAFETPSQARDEGIILAESKPLSMENRTGETIVSFDFFQDGQYALLENIDQGIEKDVGRTRFCMIIEALNADTTNYYEILFLQHYDEATNELSDLQLNNVVYEYYESPTAELAAADNFSTLVTDSKINNADLFYGVTIRPVEQSKFTPNSEGIYSAAFDTYEPIRVGHAKLTMRVAREGIFNVTSTSANNTNDVPDNGTVRYQEDMSYRVSGEQAMNYEGFAILSDQGEENNRLVVIGNNVREVDHIDGDKIVIKRGAHIEAGDPIYPMSYVAYLLCSNREWDEATQSYKTSGTPVSVKLDNISVQPYFLSQETGLMKEAINNDDTTDVVRSRFRDSIVKSDNIIFEADLDSNTVHEFNHFQLQVYWRSMANKPSESFAGRIYDLSVSLDRKVR